MGKAAASAVGSAVGGLLGGHKDGGSSQTQSTAPWSVQQPYIEDAYKQARGIYDQASSVPLPSTYVAGPNQYQTDTATNLANAGNTSGSAYSVYNPIYGQSASLIGNGSTYGSHAAQFAQAGIGAESPYTSALGAYGTTGQLQGSQGQQNYNTGVQTALTAAQSGLNYQNGLAAADAGANSAISSPTLRNAIDGANASLNRDLTQNTLPQIRAAASANGNANSSREGALEALATTNTQQQMLNNADQLTQQAYQTGYNGGLSTYGQGLMAAINGGQGVANLALSQTGQQLGALSGAGSQDLGYATANQGAKLAGNSQLGTGYGLGVGSAQTMANGQLSALDQALSGANALQTQDQSTVNNGLDAYQYQTQMPSQILNNYWNIVGQKQGSSMTGSSTPDNGGWRGAVRGAIGGAMTGGNIFGDLFGSKSSSGGGWGSDFSGSGL